MSSQNGDEEANPTLSKREGSVQSDVSNSNQAHNASPIIDPSSPNVHHTHSPMADNLPVEPVTPMKRSISDLGAAPRVSSLQMPHLRHSISSASGNPKTKNQSENSNRKLVSQHPVKDSSKPNVPMILNEPHEQVENFDWEELSVRYHQRVKELDENESKIFEEYNELSRAFTVWAQSGPKHESENSFKRLKTQMMFVRNEEDQLEQRRMHYVKVIEAFQSALQLLGS